MKIIFFSLFVFLNFQLIFAQNNNPTFGARVDLGLVKNNNIIEASGISASIKNHGVIWTHNDSGNKNRVFALDTNGNTLGEFYLNDVTNRDWEDIAIGPGPDETKSYLYVAEIGDNNSQYTFKYIYRFEEPEVKVGQDSVSSTILNISKITFFYPDGPRDAETLMLDPVTKDLYIVSKENTDVRLYKLSYPQSTSQNIQAEIAAHLTMPNDPEENKPFNEITAGDISFDGTEILLKTYRNIYYWYRNSQQTIAQAMSVDAQILPFANSLDESQSEAVCWKPYADRGYYTLSEEKINYNGIELNFPAHLYYYPRTSVINSSEEQNNLINQINLEQNFPNPFNPTTTIKYSIPSVADTKTLSSSNVTIKIFDILGKEIKTISKQRILPGNYEIKIDGTDLSSGIYYYVLQIGNFQKAKKMVLIK